MTQIVTIIGSCILTMVLVPVNILHSRKIGSVDKPRSRSIHDTITPKSGGISIFFAIFITQIVLILLHKQATNDLFYGLLIGGFLIIILGLLDDIYDLHAWLKVLIEIGIVLIMITFNFKIELLTNPFGNPIQIGIFSYPVTIIWFLLVINAINLIDGLDGLAAGIIAIVSLILGIAGLTTGNHFVALFSFTIMGSCIGFLRYNFHPARIFLGDAGSLYLGFNIAALSVAGNAQYKGATALTMLVPIIVLSVPLIDTLVTIFRRIKSTKHIFQADKNHLHHKLLGLGLSYKTVVLIGYFITLLFGLISLGFLLVDRKILLCLLLGMGVLIFIIFYNIIKSEFLKNEKK